MASKPAPRAFNYKPPSLDSMKERAENTGRSFDSIFKPGFDTFRPKVGINNLRCLPATWDDPKHYAYEVHLHSFVGPSKSTYLCPLRMLNKPCAMCEMAERMAAEPENAKQLQPRTGFISWILDRNDLEPKTRLKPKLWQASWTMNQDFSILAYNTKNPEKTLYIDHPDLGYDISFKREGKGKNDTKYLGLQIEREQSPITEADEDYWAILDFIQAHPIPSVLNFYDYDFLKKVITGQVVEADEDEANEEETPGNTREAEAGNAASPRRRGPPADEEEAAGEAEEAVDEQPVRGQPASQPRQRSTRDVDPAVPAERARPRGRQETETSEDEGENQRVRPARTR